MPSRDGLLAHLRDAHRERLHLAEQLGMRFGVLPYSALGSVHGRFHELDRDDSHSLRVVNSEAETEPPRLRETAAAGPQEGGQ